ncbi:hypothetical protein CDAR_478241 [Caerostris darwini]|uniref:Uncharacterized protein n=1 Tax=Caerostris darwini TaxID=1538125 RepID=A0AAV4UK35_9ARAC|nr:hypothetical protein CDAR_478241 [Caerostris darwini]
MGDISVSCKLFAWPRVTGNKVFGLIVSPLRALSFIERSTDVACPKWLIESRHLGCGTFLDSTQMNGKKQQQVIILIVWINRRKASLVKETRT